MQDYSKMTDEQLQALYAQRQQGQPTVIQRTAPVVEDEALQPVDTQSTINYRDAQTEKIRRELQEEQQQALTDEQKDWQKATGQAFRRDEFLKVIRQARSMIREGQGEGWEGLLKDIPGTRAKQLSILLDTLRGNLAFDRLQEMRDESKTGGALGQVSNIELRLLESTVAGIDQLDSLGILDALDRVERKYIGVMMMNDGIDPKGQFGKGLAAEEYGYTGYMDDMPEEDIGLASGDTRANILPEKYQQEHLRYLRDNWGRMDPEGYSTFRARLDEAYGLTPDLNAYQNFAIETNQYAAEGATPEMMGAVPSPTEEMSKFEQRINEAAQTNFGAFATQGIDSATAGLISTATGNSDKMELLREARPGATMGGDLIGSTLGATLLGGGAGIGAKALANPRLASLLSGPYGAELVHSATHGLTQGGLEGGGIATAASLAGGKLGQTIARNVAPDVLAPIAYRRAAESVPDRDTVKAIAGQQYDDALAAGTAADATQIADLKGRIRSRFRQDGLMGGNGQLVIDEGKTRGAWNLIDTFDQNMTPQQAEQIRKRISQGLTSPDASERRVAAGMLEEFDDWAQQILPGISDARATASRYLQADRVGKAIQLGEQRGARMKGNDVGDALRTRFGQMDDAILRDGERFSPTVNQAVKLVAEGDTGTNLMRNIGKWGAGSPITASPMAIAGAAGSYVADSALPGVAAATTLAAGTGARKLAERNTRRAADEAYLTALGGEEYAALLEYAKNLASTRGGNMLGGLFGGVGVINTRDDKDMAPGAKYRY